MFSIYRITNNINGKRYVGKTSLAPEQRWKKHLNAANLARCQHRHLYCAIRKYGESAFSVILLELTETNEAASRIEKFWIKFYNCTNRSVGYNNTDGGEGAPGLVVPPHVRKAVSEANRRRVWKPESRAKAAANVIKRDTGAKRSPESVARMIEAQNRPEVLAKHALRVGEKRPPETGLKISAKRKGAKLSAQHQKAFFEGSQQRWIRRRGEMKEFRDWLEHWLLRKHPL